MRTNNQRFVFVDALRGIAAFAVVLFHAGEADHIPALMSAVPGLAAIVHHGNLGVAVFFALSGFVITHSLYQQKITPSLAGRFLLRRSVRLDPPYWVAIAVVIGFGLLSSHFVAGKTAPDVSLRQFAAHLLYLQDLMGFPEISNVFWTLCLEVQFYLIYVVLLAFGGHAVAAAIILSLLWPLGLVSNHMWDMTFLPLWHAFLLGAAAYWAWRIPRLTAFCGAFALMVITAAILRDAPFTFVGGLTGLLLWAAAVTGRLSTALNWRWLQFLGAVSYSLYLTHNPITGASFRIGYMLTGHTPALEAVWFLAALATCVLFAGVMWWAVEKPSTKLARSISLRAPSRRLVQPDG